MFDKLIKENKNEIINQTCELIKIPSVSVETENPTLPFGEICTKALNHVLELGTSLGFRTKNIDNYCGYIEFGEGEKLVGIIGHLDVVPALEEDGWTTPPFSPKIRDGKIFGRGSIDDKGPVIASLYAMKAVKDSCKVSKRVRLIIGLNEERNWKCINYYKEHEEWPELGFSPDANFPGIFAEKGILSIELKNYFKIKDFEILDISTNNNAINVVPKYASITLKPSNCSLLENIINKKEENISISKLDDNILKIESFGIAAHAAHPELGKNAIKQLVEFLLKNFKFETEYLKTVYDAGLFDIESPRFMSEAKLEDESGVLTSNVAILEYENENNKLVIKINLRVPVTLSLDEIQNKYTSLFNNIEVDRLSVQEPLYVEKDSYLVRTLVDIFNKKSNSNASPIAIGGGTYARAFDNFISYGVTMPGKKDMCHQVDEFIEIDDLILASKIYAEALYELAK
ncbi:MAG: dipeptidase PepV [Clostridia bacterium]|nr:dipeptidase PepV [Clostridia bacterium]